MEDFLSDRCGARSKSLEIAAAASRRIPAASGQELLGLHIVSWLKATWPRVNYVCSKMFRPCTQSKRPRNFAAYWTSNIWPPFSPDLNTLDFTNAHVLDSKVQRTCHPTGETLEAPIEQELRALSSTKSDRCARALRPCLEAVIAGDGDEIE